MPFIHFALAAAMWALSLLLKSPGFGFCAFQAACFGISWHCLSNLPNDTGQKDQEAMVISRRKIVFMALLGYSMLGVGIVFGLAAILGGLLPAMGALVVFAPGGWRLAMDKR